MVNLLALFDDDALIQRVNGQNSLRVGDLLAVDEDAALLRVNTPAGQVVHPGHGNYSGTLVNALTYHLRNLPQFQEGDMRAGLVHRID